MQKFTVSGFVNRPQQDVFDFLSDPANFPKRDSDFKSAEWTSSDAPGTEATYEYQFEIVDTLKFAVGFVARMGKKRIEGNLNPAKRLLEAS